VTKVGEGNFLTAHHALTVLEAGPQRGEKISWSPVSINQSEIISVAKITYMLLRSPRERSHYSMQL